MDFAMAADLHRHTPSLSAIDPRGLPVVAVSYHRADAGDPPEAHTGRGAYDAAGRLHAQWDARSWADGGEGGMPDQRSVHGLSGQVLRTQGVDTGWRIALFGDAGQALEGWDGRATHRRGVYDRQLRPLSVHERQAGAEEGCVERFTYGGASETATNRCGRLIRHDDQAGSRTCAGVGLTGQELAQTQRFLRNLDMPDWPVSATARDALLETTDAGLPAAYTSRSNHDALGSPVHQTDASGNTRQAYRDVAGRVLRTSFTPAAGETTVVLDDLLYDAYGAVTSETAGNGVVTTATFSDVDGRLLRLQATRPGKILQDLAYTYDPVGNVLRIEDAAQPTDWFDGTQVEPVSTYRHDTLYRLVEASGRESVHAGIGPGLPGLGGPGGGADASRRRRYIQTYIYDAGGNLRTLSHLASDQTQYTRTMHMAGRGNRGLYQADPERPPDLDAAFDANGNLLHLEGVQAMTWDTRNQLRRVTQVLRADGDNDDEVYVYDSGGQRRRKLRVTQARAVTHLAEVRYLPGLEIRTDTATGETYEVAIAQAGRSAMRWLRWQANGRKALPAPQWRYGLDDHLGSAMLELDGQAAVISHEGYYPYGGTAWWAAASATEANYKTIRYSGKERDATGLYYYGFRYYAPWLQRWINPDPAGTGDGMNVYAFVGSDPVGHRDPSGQTREDALRHWKSLYNKPGGGPIMVSRVDQGMVSVSITGDHRLFEALGFAGLSEAPGPRTLHYLAVDPKLYEGIVSGGVGLVNPLAVSPVNLAGYSGAAGRKMAYITGGFFNVDRAAHPFLEDSAPIGAATSNLRPLPAVRIPADYMKHYRKLEFGASTFLHAAPALTKGGDVVFDASPSDELFQFDMSKEARKRMLTPGRLHHSEHPNARSGISRPSAPLKEGKVRLVVGMGTGGRGPLSIGYTMWEWASVMSRIDHLDDEGANTIPHDSTNLDGGGSSMMGAIDESARRTYNISQGPEGRALSTMITFRQRQLASAAVRGNAAAGNSSASRRCCSIL
ncbi:RHS repeat-associated core domain-containing protein [Luteibacter yeojuensis]